MPSVHDTLIAAGFVLTHQAPSSTRYVSHQTGERVLIFPDGKLVLLPFVGNAVELTADELRNRFPQ